MRGAEQIIMFSSSAALSRAAQMLASETDGLAIDFTDLSLVIKDTTTPANAFSGDPNSKLTYTSPSTKWIRNSTGLLVSGTTFRTSYHADGTALGILCEEARTNLALQSADFSTTWTRSAVLAFGSGSTVNAGVAPDGTTTADLIVPDTTNDTHFMAQSGLSTSASTFSVFVKAAGYSKVMLFFGGTNNGALFDLATGGATATGHALANNVTSAGIEAYPNGWYRIWATSTTSNSTVRIYVLSDFTNATFVADGTSGIYAWGAQFEVGTSVSSYIPTTTVTVARARDNISLAVSAIPFSTSVGTMLLTYFPMDTAAFSYGSVFDAGNNNNLIAAIPNDGTQARFLVIAAASTVANVGGASFGVSQRTKMAVSWATNSARLSVDAVAGAEDVSVTVPAGITTLRLGDRFGGGRPMNGFITSFLYLPRQMSQSDGDAATTPYGATPIALWGDSRSIPSSWGDDLVIADRNAHRLAREYAELGVSGENASLISARVVADTTYTTRVQTFWALRNDINNPAETFTTPLPHIATAVAAFQSRSNRYIVLGATRANTANGNNAGTIVNSEAAGTTIGIQIDAWNASLLASYGDNYLDINAALCAWATMPNPELVSGGYLPTANDIADAALGRCPRGLLAPSDAIHYGTPGYRVISYFVAAKAAALGY